MMTSSIEALSKLLAFCEGNAKATGGFPHKASDADLVFLWRLHKQTTEKTFELPVIWDALGPL